VWAITGREQMQQTTLANARYSITSSARSRIDVGTDTPIALAVFRLRANSKLVGCSTGKSDGFAPLRILATNDAARQLMTDTVEKGLALIGEQ